MTAASKDRLAWLTIAARNLSAATVVLSFMWSLWSFGYGPIRAWLNAQAALASEDAAFKVKVLERLDASAAADARQVLENAALARQIEIMQAPAIVEYGPASGFPKPCHADRPCLLLLEVRRTSPAAEACKIMAGRTQRLLGHESGRSWNVALVTQREATNIDQEFRLVEVMIQMPASIPPGRITYQQTTAYTECPWQQNGEPPAFSQSRLMDGVIEESKP